VAKIVKPHALCHNIRYWSGIAPDSLPIPPLKLIVLVAGTPRISWFLESGKLAAWSILDTLRKNGLNIDNFQTILDFGCGCGRVIRRWNSLERANIYGADYNPELTDWCRRKLTFAQFETNQLFPPLSYSDEKFDFIYALSVFTHMREALQLLWINELSRVIRPGGYLLITTHGEPYFEKLTREEQKELKTGRLIVRCEEASGTNLCSVYHPVKYVQEKLAKGFEVVDFIPEGAKGNPSQDIFLLRKPTDVFNKT